MTKEERDYEVKKLERKNRELQELINRRLDSIKELKAMPVEPEIDIIRYSLNTKKVMEIFSNGEYCLYSDVEKLVAKLTKPAPYEQGKVFWSVHHQKVWMLSGEYCSHSDWNVSSKTLYEPDNSWRGRIKATVINTPIYWHDGVPYIWDGGDERPTVDGDIYLGDDGMVYFATNILRLTAPRRILIPLEVVG